MTTRQAVIAIATEELGDAAPPPDADLSEHLDSVQKLALVVAIEDHFEIAFNPEDDDAVTTLDDVVRIVERHQALP